MTKLRTAFLVGGVLLLLLVGSPGTSTARTLTRVTPSGGYYYTVHYGDTLSGIATWTYGSASAWGCIARANGLANGNYIWAGQTLWLPPDCMSSPGTGGSARYHTVQYGQTLSGIACMYYYDCNYWRIANANGLGNPNYIWAGQVLWVPFP